MDVIACCVMCRFGRVKRCMCCLRLSPVLLQFSVAAAVVVPIVVAVVVFVLKVEVIDRNRNGSDLNAIATGTGFFTVKGSGPGFPF